MMWRCNDHLFMFKRNCWKCNLEFLQKNLIQALNIYFLITSFPYKLRLSLSLSVCNKALTWIWSITPFYPTITKTTFFFFTKYLPKLNLLDLFYMCVNPVGVRVSKTWKRTKLLILIFLNWIISFYYHFKTITTDCKTCCILDLYFVRSFY